MNNSLDDKLVSSLFRSSCDPGLAYGKMGICIYLFQRGRLTHNISLVNHAEMLLDEITGSVTSLESIDIKRGVSGIGIGITYLIKNNFVKGNLNTVLSDLDDILFRSLGYPNLIKEKSFSSLAQTLYYLLLRLRELRKGSVVCWLYQELIIEIINQLDCSAEDDLYTDPVFFNADYQLPAYIFALTEAAKYYFYREKILKILEEALSQTFCVVPSLDSNKLFLLWSVYHCFKSIKFYDCGKYINLLKSAVSIDRIIRDELKNVEVYLNDGIACVYFLLSQLHDLFSEQEMLNWKKKMLARLKQSEVWELLEDDKYFDSHRGLLDGYCGISTLKDYLL